MAQATSQVAVAGTEIECTSRKISEAVAGLPRNCCSFQKTSNERTRHRPSSSAYRGKRRNFTAIVSEQTLGQMPADFEICGFTHPLPIPKPATSCRSRRHDSMLADLAWAFGAAAERLSRLREANIHARASGVFQVTYTQSERSDGGNVERRMIEQDGWTKRD